MGDVEGLEDGRLVGAEDGLLVGWNVGDVEGLEDGRLVGAEDGLFVGWNVGDVEGLEDGRLVGFEGLEDGRLVGKDKILVKLADIQMRKGKIYICDNRKEVLCLIFHRDKICIFTLLQQKS